RSFIGAEMPSRPDKPYPNVNRRLHLFCKHLVVTEREAAFAYAIIDLSILRGTQLVMYPKDASHAEGHSLRHAGPRFSSSHQSGAGKGRQKPSQFYFVA